MNASTLILEEAKKTSPDLQKIAQMTADTSAMLSHASYEVSKEKRLFLSKPKYRPLCYEKEADGWLFGKDIPAKIKDLNLRNQLKNDYSLLDDSSFLDYEVRLHLPDLRQPATPYSTERTQPHREGPSDPVFLRLRIVTSCSSR